jgi:nitrite reductase (NADH) large subunit
VVLHHPRNPAFGRATRAFGAIADAADKYAIPAVKGTGGQRIDLFGVKKADLPHIWADLNTAGLVRGHAYSKGLRTVKTCVGTDYCRFGTQDSTGLGIRLEQRLWGAWTAHKAKLAVSDCPRTCAEATCKDVGIICVEKGFVLARQKNSVETPAVILVSWRKSIARPLAYAL